MFMFGKSKKNKKSRKPEPLLYERDDAPLYPDSVEETHNVKSEEEVMADKTKSRTHADEKEERKEDTRDQEKDLEKKVNRIMESPEDEDTDEEETNVKDPEKKRQKKSKPTPEPTEADKTDEKQRDIKLHGRMSRKKSNHGKNKDPEPENEKDEEKKTGKKPKNGHEKEEALDKKVIKREKSETDMEGEDELEKVKKNKKPIRVITIGKSEEYIKLKRESVPGDEGNQMKDPRYLETMKDSILKELKEKKCGNEGAGNDFKLILDKPCEIVLKKEPGAFVIKGIKYQSTRAVEDADSSSSTITVVSTRPSPSTSRPRRKKGWFLKIVKEFNPSNSSYPSSEEDL